MAITIVPQSPKPTLLVAVTGVVIVVLAKMVVLLVVAMMFVVAVVSTTLHRHLESNEQPRQHHLTSLPNMIFTNVP